MGIRAAISASLLLALISGCGNKSSTASSEKGEEKAPNLAEINAGTFTPPSGTYNFIPWVSFKKSTATGKPSFLVRKQDETDFADTDCSKNPLNTSEDEACFSVSETSKWDYFRNISGTPTKLGTLEYVISPVKNDLTFESRETKESEAADETYLMDELGTSCSYGDSAMERIFVTIKSRNFDKIGVDSAAYVMFSLPADTVNNTDVEISQKSKEFTAGIRMLHAADEIPHGNIEKSDEYTTSQFPNYVTTLPPGASCSMNVTAIDISIGDIKGTIKCMGLRNYDSDVEDAKKPLGKHLNINGNWQCDRFL